MGAWNSAANGPAIPPKINNFLYSRSEENHQSALQRDFEEVDDDAEEDGVSVSPLALAAALAPALGFPAVDRASNCSTIQVASPPPALLSACSGPRFAPPEMDIMEKK
eukprot:CAMPEP_0174964038 /NCGR_PEP_ID=MMETSP0004_2-20121128/5659_1 /TAXON_ID=420556 /ORGANISM="Ochromonas sp., Strain CCMP1393" /LENGTH=107 /DNA_ID=CAMNT_0016212721 /DNA_START=562 /DNA_END=885 /DNA_ORIENTATION=-